MHPCSVTVVTIAKNNYHGLSRTLESVKNQDYGAIEHIVIDGNSNDGSKELLGTYVHSKTYRFVSEPDRGISSALNKGLAQATGDLVFFLNSGDCFASQTIVSEVVASYRQHHWRCAQGGVLAPNHAREAVTYRPPQLPSHFLHYLMFLPHQGFWCETALHQRYQFDESIKTSMDYDLFLRMLMGVEIFYLPTVITRCELEEGIAANWQLRVMEQSQIRLKHTSNPMNRAIVKAVNALIYLKNLLRIDSPFARASKASDRQTPTQA
jgi:putative colanic acid biosynthesis glycosyltransferase